MDGPLPTKQLTTVSRRFMGAEWLYWIMGESDKVTRERLESAPGEVYTETVQKPNFDFKRDHFYGHLIHTNKAWIVMLREVEIIDAEATSTILNVLRDLEAEGPDALGSYDSRLEEFYSHMEYQLNERIGEQVAGNINIGRTRPEPLARMETRDYLLDILDKVNDLRGTLLDLAEREVETVMPQWTHYQHAQISTVGHYLVGFVDSLDRDAERLFHAYDTVNQSTLGCGALAGSSYPLDRQLVAELLGFDGFKENTIDDVAGGDHHTEPAAGVASLMVTLSRLSLDLYTWHTWEFDMVEIGDEFSGSSSLMPQKKNPYPFETIQDAAAGAIGTSTTVHEVLHNTPFQDVKHVEEGAVKPLYSAFEEVDRMLRLANGTVATAEFNAERMRSLAAEGFASCTELAASIHRMTDLSYRTAHRIVGDVVQRAIDRDLNATEVTADLVNESAEAVIGRTLDIDDEFVHSALDPESFINAHDVPGGPAPTEVRRAIQDRRGGLDADRVAVHDRIEQLNQAAERLSDRVDDLVSG